MASTKIAITLDEHLLYRLDQLVARQQFRSRSQAVGDALRQWLARVDRFPLDRECRKLDWRFEQAFAEGKIGY